MYQGYSPALQLIYASMMIRLLLIFVAFTSVAHADDLRGKPRIVDGDTIWIGKTKIRLHGIDTPEMKQECKDADGNDKYGRMIGSCEVGDMDINREMVVSGLARAYRQYSKRYLYEEHGAMRNKAGMWGGECMAPWEWRRK